MDKWEKQLNEQMNQPLPERIDIAVSNTLSTLPSKKKNRKGVTYAFISAAVVFLLMVSMSLLSPSFASSMKNLPIVGSAFEYASSAGILKGAQENLVTAVGEEVIIDGKTVIFTDTLYDGSQIHIGYMEEFDEELGHGDFPGLCRFTINGKEIGSYGWGGTGTYLDNGWYAGTVSVRIPDLPDSFELGIKPFKGNAWSVELPVEKKGKSETFIVNERKESGNISLSYHTVTFHPTSTAISLTSSYPEAYGDEFNMLDYHIVDENDRIIQSSSAGGSGQAKDGLYLNEYSLFYEPLNEKPEQLTITPFLDQAEREIAFVRMPWKEEPVTLSQGEVGSVTVHSIASDDDATYVTYTLKGEHVSYQSQSLWMEDQEGNEYRSHSAPEYIEDTGEYRLELERAPDLEGVIIVTVEQEAVQFLDDLQVTISIE
ncbi:hypothetical protein CR205_03085 [Alteribacter lacisalsi]|uniref:DUF4179 domain-containing protein n=1 Tax=Alteribacter lacisalsi TaxID=2045244 RepID=A0A2W0H6W9_9BACI|nr:DUF4179 domain-containing protein [Alteribacter lacisalsi]PYZ97594.1 hypothetical protein CR205_03085 [Alteribacter lacisalsi]